MKNSYRSLDKVNKIRALPKELADKIAAGEVVERPLSIVKELVENSVDAGSTNITIEIKKGGKEYIRVTDNGRGIPKDELPLAFKRYATSKISSENDLENIVSLGFRGEALASIAAVSKLELISKTKDNKIGAKIIYEAGEELGIFDASCEDGTTIVVKELFYNLPARRKFLKADNTESSLIADYVQKMALAYPEIKFRFINNGTILFSTLGKGNLYEAILTLYSPQIARSLVELDYTEDNIRVYGYVSSAETSKTNKRSQISFVNGRWVRSKIIDSAIEDAYSDKLFEGRHPICFIFIELDPSDIDVNVHPNKTEIKFYDENKLKEILIKAIRRTLRAESAAPNIANLADKKNFVPVEKAVEKAEFYTQSVENSYVNDNIFLTTEKQDDFFKSIREEQQSIEIPSVSEVSKLFKFSDLKPLAQIFTTYIIATNGSNMFIIDQHAAHERIMYEKLLSKFNSAEKLSQIMISPILIHTNPSQTAAEEQWKVLLEEIGFKLENFGQNEYIITEIPSSLSLEEAEKFVNTVLENDFDNPKRFQEKKEAIISASCKAAVKAGDKLSDIEILALFEDLDKCENPFSCPHGRPTFLRFSEYEIEKFFKRK